MLLEVIYTLQYTYRTHINIHQDFMLKFTKLSTKSPKLEYVHENKPIHKLIHKIKVLRAYTQKHDNLYA